MTVLGSIQGDAPDRADGFELAYVARDGAQARVALADAGSLLPGERTREYDLDRTCPAKEVAAIGSRDTSEPGREPRLDRWRPGQGPRTRWHTGGSVGTLADLLT